MARLNAKDKLLAAASALMRAKGFAATTVDEICAKAAVSKGSFYHYFDSKESLAVAVLDQYYRRAVERLGKGAYRGVADPLQRVFGYLDHAEALAKELWGSGCLLGGFATDLAATHPLIRRQVSQLFAKVSSGLAGLFEPAARQGGRGGPSSTELAEHFLAVVEGSIVLAKAHDDWRRIPQGIKSFRRYLQRLVD